MFEKQPWMHRAGEYPRSDREYFGLLARAVFSAGLGPKVVESRWKEMTEAFHGWDPAAVAQMDESDVGRLLADPAVIRNRRKIEAVIRNAGVFAEVVTVAPAGRPAGAPWFHSYLEGLGAGRDLDATSESLSHTFAHLGRTSALFFLFSAGWRPREAADPADERASGAAAMVPASLGAAANG
jgi:DNA-3-methyladenine glycosylase I